MSKLQTALKKYLAVRRQLGFKLREEGSLLPKFIHFVEQEGASFVTRDLALRWAMQPTNVLPAWWAARLRMVRHFAQYLRAADPRTEVPPHGLLAATGMRLRESINLHIKDVDLKNGILTIYKTKFGKSRLVPIHPSTQRVLQQYEYQRDRIYPNPRDPNFFISDLGTKLTGDIVRWTFVKLSRRIGLRGSFDSHGPRLHDFRHGFAVRTILNWYRAGVDVERHILKLATYLGHTHVNDTYWYLSAVPELMQLAAMRLDQT